MTIPQLPLEIAAIKICGPSPAPMQTVPTEIEEKSEPEMKSTPEATATEKKTVEKIKEAFVKEEPTKKPKKAEKAEGGNDTPLTITYLKEQWNAILEETKPAPLRRSLADALIARVEDDKVFLRFRSEFHMSKVNHAEQKAVVEKLLGERFGQNIQINCELEKMSLTPSGEGKADPKDIAKHAMEIFGGEMDE